MLSLHPTAMPDWLTRWTDRRRTDAATSRMSSRVEVCPPELFPSSVGWRGTLRSWLRRLGLQPEAQRPVNRLGVAKGEFLMHLSDLPGEGPRQLAERIGRVRSLRELWHLRMATYGAVAQACSQAEAERRLAELNRHFPIRSGRAAALSTAAQPGSLLRDGAGRPPLAPDRAPGPGWRASANPGPSAPRLGPVEQRRAEAPTQPAPL